MSTRTIAGVVLWVSCVPCLAGQLVYAPLNPAFGGNPLNGTFLLNEAAAQNSKTNPSAISPGGAGFQQLTPLQQFNQSLQSAILNRIASAITGGVVDSGGKLIAGTVSTTDFIITIVQIGPNLVRITTTDKASGQSTQFEVSQ